MTVTWQGDGNVGAAALHSSTFCTTVTTSPIWSRPTIGGVSLRLALLWSRRHVAVRGAGQRRQGGQGRQWRVINTWSRPTIGDLVWMLQAQQLVLLKESTEGIDQ